MTTDKLICAVESGKYEGAPPLSLMKNTLWNQRLELAKLFIRVWFNVDTELEEYLYLHALLFLIEFLDLTGLYLGGVKFCWSDTGYNVFRTRGRCTLDRKDGRHCPAIKWWELRHYCIQAPALCDGGSMVVWVGIHKGGKTSLVAPDGNVNAFM